MHNDFILIDDEDRFNHKNNNNPDISVDSDLGLGDTKLETAINAEKTLQIKRPRNKAENQNGASDRKRLRLSKEKEFKKSNRKRNLNFKVTELGKNEGKSTKPKEIANRISAAFLQKELEGKTSPIDLNDSKNLENFSRNFNENRSIVVKTIKLSLDRLKKFNRQQNNDFQLLKEDNQGYSTPNKLNFYKEHTKRFYRNYNNLDLGQNQMPDINVLIQQSPFKIISVEQSYELSKNYMSLYSDFSKAFLMIGIMGVVYLVSQFPSVNDCLEKVAVFLQENWKTEACVLIAIVVMFYFFHKKMWEKELAHRENVARMIIENMKIVFNSEKNNGNSNLSISEDDIVLYFSHNLKVSEEFFSENVLPIIIRLLKDDESVYEIRENVQDYERISWKHK